MVVAPLHLRVYGDRFGGGDVALEGENDGGRWLVKVESDSTWSVMRRVEPQGRALCLEFVIHIPFCMRKVCRTLLDVEHPALRCDPFPA